MTKISGEVWKISKSTMDAIESDVWSNKSIDTITYVTTSGLFRPTVRQMSGSQIESIIDLL